MSNENVTIADARRSAKSLGQKLRLTQVLWTVAPPPYDEWASTVETAIAYASAKMALKRNYLDASSEDALTSALLLMLDGIGFDADMRNVNGNCDVVVKLDDYMWLGEAKLATSPSWIWKGYLQLTTRYAPGQKNQDRGGMIIYCVDTSVPVAMASWRAALCTQLSIDDAHLEAWSESDNAFRSEALVVATGRVLKVLHQAVPLLHTPQDPNITLSKAASKAAKAAKRRATTTQGSKGKS